MTISGSCGSPPWRLVSVNLFSQTWGEAPRLTGLKIMVFIFVSAGENLICCAWGFFRFVTKEQEMIPNQTAPSTTRISCCSKRKNPVKLVCAHLAYVNSAKHRLVPDSAARGSTSTEMTRERLFKVKMTRTFRKDSKLRNQNNPQGTKKACQHTGRDQGDTNTRLKWAQVTIFSLILLDLSGHILLPQAKCVKGLHIKLFNPPCQCMLGKRRRVSDQSQKPTGSSLLVFIDSSIVLVLDLWGVDEKPD